MNIQPFKLEEYFAKYEFSAPYLLCPSDCEPFTLNELLAYADGDTRDLWEKLSLGYTETQGLPLLRQEIAHLYAQVAPDDVLVVTPEEGIFIGMHALLEPGDHVIATFPGYQSLYEIAVSLGCEVTYWTADEANGWAFDVDWLETAIQPNTRLIVVNFPHNPTGYLTSKAEFARILELARARNITVFSDEMYRFLEYDPADRLDSAVDVYADAVVLGGLSKAFGLPGLRIGWLVARNHDLYQKFVLLKAYTTICSSAPSEILALMALRARARVIERSLAIVRENLARLDGFFERHAAILSWVRPRAGSIAFPKLLLPQDIATFCAEVVEKQGVMLLPGSVYDDAGSHFRIGFGRRSLPDALAQLEAFIREAASI